MAGRRVARIARHLGVCLFYVPLTVWATWPLAGSLADHVLDGPRLHGPLGLLTQADILLQAWILAWDTHALLTHPAGLLDANIFHPARWSLVRSEHILGDVPLFAPVYLTSGNPILAHQAATLLTCVLSAVAAYAAAWRWFRRVDAAFLAGALFGLGPWPLTMLPQIQTVSAMYLPVVLLAGTEVLSGGGRGWAILLAAATALQSLCSAYLAAVTFTLTAAVLVTWWIVAGLEWRTLARYLAALALAGAVATAAYVPGAWLARAGAIPTPTRATQEALAAHPLASYTPGLGRPVGEAYRFLGIPAAALGVVGLLTPASALRRPGLGPLRAVLVGVGVTGYVISLGPTLRLSGAALPLPFALLARLPGLSALRAPSRFGILVTLAASLLAALGLAALGARRRALGPALLVLALGLLGAEARRFAFPLRAIETGADVPPVYRWIATHGGGEPVLELPVGVDSLDYGTMYTQSRYAYFSTYHWSPLLNGYAGYPPDGFFLVMAIARRLPERDALQDLVNLTGLRWIVLHRAPPGSERAVAWERAEGIATAGRWADDVAVRVTLPATADLRAALAWPRAGPTTLSGTPVAPLPPDAMRGALADIALPSRVRAGWTVGGSVTVENGGGRTWPGLRAAPEGLVHVGYRWLDGDGRVLDTVARLSRVPADVEPGERLRVPFAVQAPARPGRYRLRVTLVQRGGAWFDEHGGPSTTVPVDVSP